MRNLGAAVSTFILVAVLGSQVGLTHAVREKWDIHRIESHVAHHDAPDCCFSYVSRILCSRFVYYFPTSGGCINPGIIFVSKRGNRLCANPLDQQVQECIRRLKQILGPGNTAIA